MLITVWLEKGFFILKLFLKNRALLWLFSWSSLKRSILCETVCGCPSLHRSELREEDREKYVWLGAGIDILIRCRENIYWCSLRYLRQEMGPIKHFYISARLRTPDVNILNWKKLQYYICGERAQNNVCVDFNQRWKHSKIKFDLLRVKHN